MERREVVKGIALLGATEKLTDGGLAEITEPGSPARGTSVLPPGAGRREDFLRQCTACQLCVANCPEKVIRPSLALKTFGQPELDFRRGFCRLACTRCGFVCPTGALKRLQAEQRPYVHMGTAVWRRDLCLRTGGEKCVACVRRCPVQAIALVGGFPVVDELTCIGCGACEHVCPARPEPAIYVKGAQVQRMTVPMGQADLLGEMQRLIDGGKAAVVARDGKIVLQLEGRGVKPIVDAINADPQVFAGAAVADKIVGRAAAAVYVVGGAKTVYAKVMSQGAKTLLESHGVRAEAGEFVARIINRERTGECPMEQATAGMEDVQQILDTLRKAIQQ